MDPIERLEEAAVDMRSVCVGLRTAGELSLAETARELLEEIEAELKYRKKEKAANAAR